MNPFKKRRLLKQVYREEKNLLQEVKGVTRSGFLQQAESDADLDNKIERLESMIHELTPRRRLDWISIITRVGVAVVLFYLVTAPAVMFVQQNFLSSSLKNTSSGVGQAHVIRFVPTQAITISQSETINSVSHFSPRKLEGASDLGGVVAGLVPQQNGVTVLWTDMVAGRRVLFREGVGTALQSLSASSTVWNDVDLSGASAAQSSGTVAVLGTSENHGKPQIILQTFDSDWKALTVRKMIPALPTESLDGMEVYPWHGGWAVVSLVQPLTQAVFDHQQTHVRLLDPQLSVLWENTVPTEEYLTDRYASFADNPAGGFYLISNLRPVVQGTRALRGDDLYLITCNKNGLPDLYQRITNNGPPDDFWPSGLFTDDKGYHFVGAHQIDAPGFQLPNWPAGYPMNTGKSYLYVFDPDWKLVGTLFAFDGLPSTQGAEFIGAAHTRVAKVGDELFAAFDLIRQSDETGKDATRAVTLSAFIVKD